MTNTTMWDHTPGTTPPVANDPRPMATPPTYAPPTLPGDAAGHGAVPPPLPPTPPPSPAQRPESPRGKGTMAKVGAGMLAGALLVGGGFALRDVTTATPAPAAVTAPSAVPANNTPAQTPQGATPATSTSPIEQIAKVLSPAVVQIETTDGLGSGVAYDQSGLIMTNAHVVGDASSVNVKFSDGTETKGQVLGADTTADIAVVKVTPPSSFTVATLSNETPAVGETVGAVGSPFGLQGTVTAGIVSATDRTVDGENGAQSSDKMIQTDAPINPGNSGGALANVNGEVIGINSSIYSQKGENNGIGFAIPIQTAKGIADDIVAGKDTRGQSSSSAGGSQGRQAPGQGQTPGQGQSKVALGVAVQAGQNGVTVQQVAKGSPAEDAGLQQGDVIVAVDGEQVSTPSDLQQVIAGHQAGDTVTLQVERDGQQGTVDVQLATASTN